MTELPKMSLEDIAAYETSMELAEDILKLMTKIVDVQSGDPKLSGILSGAVATVISHANNIDPRFASDVFLKVNAMLILDLVKQPKNNDGRSN